MKHPLTIVSLLCFIVLFESSSVFADWRGPANITKDNQQKYGISIKVYEDKKPNKYVIEIKRFRDKCCWIFPKGEPSEGFGNIIYSPEDRFNDNRLEFDETEKQIYSLDNQAIKNAYILFDYCGAILDGGYYYVIDLSTFIE